MRLVRETREGDTCQRAGIVVTDGNLLLCGQPTNMKRNNWKLDIFKGHIQQNESPLDAAIRETWEESNIRFEPWKLTNPIQTTCDNAPLFLFLAKLDKVIPTELLSCASTFVDDFDGIRKPEMETYVWINPKTQLYLVQERLHPGIRYYFSNILINYTQAPIDEDCQIAGSMMGDVPQNIGSVLSLGYKNGRGLPLPKKRSNSQNFNSIPIFETNIQPLIRKYSQEDFAQWLGNDKLIKYNSTSIWYHGGGFNHRWRNGIWFVDNPIVAKTYRESVIQKCYLKTKGKIKIFDFKGADWYGHKGSSLIMPGADGVIKLSDKYVVESFKKGYDCVILKNIRDAGYMPTKDYIPDTVTTDCIVKSASQIYWFI